MTPDAPPVPRFPRPNKDDSESQAPLVQRSAHSGYRADVSGWVWRSSARILTSTPWPAAREDCAPPDETMSARMARSIPPKPARPLSPPASASAAPPPRCRDPSAKPSPAAPALFQSASVPAQTPPAPIAAASSTSAENQTPSRYINAAAPLPAQ